MWTQLVIGALVVYGTIMLGWQSSRWLYRKQRLGQTVCFVIVTKNAERDIEGVLRQIAHACRDADVDASVVIIDICSIDLTVPIATRFSSQFMPVECVPVFSYEEAMAAVSVRRLELGSVTCVVHLGTTETSPPVAFGR